MALDRPAATDGVDVETPNAARMYDYYLGGGHNLPPDRDLAEQVKRVVPFVEMIARINRSFLRRVVRFMLDQGIGQFLDIGSGIPTAGNVHQIAHAVDPAVRVVYVDHEIVAVTHSLSVLEGTASATAVRADLRDPPAILEHPEVCRLIDFDQPLGLLLTGVMLFIPDQDDPDALVATYRDACAPGSYLAISTLSADEADPDTAEKLRTLQQLYESANDQLYARTREQIHRWFDGTRLVDPGLVLLDDWHREDPHPMDSPARLLGYGGVGEVARRGESLG